MHACVRVSACVRAPPPSPATSPPHPTKQPRRSDRRAHTHTHALTGRRQSGHNDLPTPNTHTRAKATSLAGGEEAGVQAGACHVLLLGAVGGARVPHPHELRTHARTHACGWVGWGGGAARALSHTHTLQAAHTQALAYVHVRHRWHPRPTHPPHAHTCLPGGWVCARTPLRAPWAAPLQRPPPTAQCRRQHTPCARARRGQGRQGRRWTVPHPPTASVPPRSV